MKIYFAGSIRGGRDDVGLYFEIINHLKKYGEVLTEHIGDNSLISIGEKEMSDEEICEKDMNWLINSDVIVAEVTCPSLGVGYEIGRAIEQGKKIICLFRQQDGKRLSAMIAGSKGLTVREYKNLESAKEVIDDFFEV